jgi:glycosyltransferase involved in cell wall biosynthesis
LRLVRALAEASMEVTVVSPAGPGLEEVYERDGATIVHLGLVDRLSLARGMRPWRRRATRAIAALDFDLVHGQGVLTGGLPACDIETRPRVVTARGNVARDTLAHYSGLGGRARAVLRDRLAREVVRRADTIVGVHPDWSINLPSKPASFIHIPNIVEDCFFTAGREVQPGRVLYCGGGAMIKGFDVLTDAWPAVRRAIPAAYLRATGFDPMSLTTVGQPAGVILLPGLPPAQIAEEMAAASLLVIPSRFEVTPNVLSEAWAVGLPVVCTSAGGLASMAAGAALLVPPTDPAALARAIIRVLTGDDATPVAVAEGRRRAQARTAEAIAAAHRALYGQLTATANG